MDAKSLRAMRNTDFSKITSEFEKTSSPESKSFEDTRFWKPERDKAGNATATIRFLSRTEGDDLPWIKVFSHGFKGPTGRWLIENCLTTLNKPCPVCELNTKLWNSTDDKNSPARKQVGAQKRKLNYISNVLVINDPKHPENNGKVFLFKYGKKIFDKIMDKAKPTFEDETPVNVFDYWEGANFKLRMKMADGYPNYDSSEFEGQTPVADDDDDIVSIAKYQYQLNEFVGPDHFKSYDDVKKRLEQTLSGVAIAETAASISDEDEMEIFRSAKQKAAPAPGPSKAAPVPKATKAKPKPSDDDEDMLDYFQSLASDD